MTVSMARLSQEFFWTTVEAMCLAICDERRKDISLLNSNGFIQMNY